MVALKAYIGGERMPAILIKNEELSTSNESQFTTKLNDEPITYTQPEINLADFKLPNYGKDIIHNIYQANTTVTNPFLSEPTPVPEPAKPQVSLSGAISDITQPVKDAYNAIKTSIGNGVTKVNDSVKSFYNSCKDAVNDNVINPLKQDWNTITGFCGRGTNKVKNGISSAISSVKDFYEKCKSAVNDNVINPLKQDWNTITDFCGRGTNKVKNGISSAINSVKGFYESCKNAVDNHVVEPLKQDWNAITDFYGGCKEKVTTFLNSVKKSLEPYMPGAKEKAEKLLECVNLDTQLTEEDISNLRESLRLRGNEVGQKLINDFLLRIEDNPSYANNNPQFTLVLRELAKKGFIAANRTLINNGMLEEESPEYVKILKGIVDFHGKTEHTVFALKLADYYSEHKETKKAIRIYQTLAGVKGAQRTESTFKAAEKLGDFYAKNGETSTALNYYQRALESAYTLGKDMRKAVERVTSSMSKVSRVDEQTIDNQSDITAA